MKSKEEKKMEKEVAEYINTITDLARKQDMLELVDIISKVSKQDLKNVGLEHNKLRTLSL